MVLLALCRARFVLVLSSPSYWSLPSPSLLGLQGILDVKTCEPACKALPAFIGAEIAVVGLIGVFCSTAPAASVPPCWDARARALGSLCELYCCLAFLLGLKRRCREGKLVTSTSITMGAGVCSLFSLEPRCCSSFSFFLSALCRARLILALLFCYLL